jgi:hypothetical protein
VPVPAVWPRAYCGPHSLVRSSLFHFLSVGWKIDILALLQQDLVVWITQVSNIFQKQTKNCIYMCWVRIILTPMSGRTRSQPIGHDFVKCQPGAFVSKKIAHLAHPPGAGTTRSQPNRHNISKDIQPSRGATSPDTGQFHCGGCLPLRHYSVVTWYQFLSRNAYRMWRTQGDGDTQVVTGVGRSFPDQMMS